jgi:hypothetical protein
MIQRLSAFGDKDNHYKSLGYIIFVVLAPKLSINKIRFFSDKMDIIGHEA